MTLSSRVEPDLYELVSADADSTGISLSQWLIEAVKSYLTYENFSWDDLVDLDWDELVEFVDDQDLDINPADYRNFWSGKDEDGLREEIADELDIDVEVGLTWDDLSEYDWEQLENCVEFLDIDINPADYENEDDLRESIAVELEIEMPE